MSLLVGPDGAPIRSSEPLEQPDVRLPPASEAPETTYAMSDDEVGSLLEHDHVLVRQYAVEQVAHRRLAAVDLEPRLEDDSMVAAQAARALETLEVSSAVPAVERALARAKGGLAAVLAGTLGALAPERLLPALKAKGRLDDETFIGGVGALAVAGTEPAHAYLGRSLNRAALQSPERRTALYAAALLSGAPELVRRVLDQAIDESLREAPPDGTSHPARAALASVTGGPRAYALPAAHQELWTATTDTLELEARPLMEEARASVLESALRERRAKDVLAALEPFASFEIVVPTDSEADDLGSMPTRRRGLLGALVAHREAVGRLNPESAALFVAAAARSVAITAFGRGSDRDSPGGRAIAKALEGKLSDEAADEVDPAARVAALQSVSERELRPFFVALTRERFRRAGTIRRWARASLEAGHGRALFSAAAESPDVRVHEAVVRAARDEPRAAEAAALELLEARPLDPPAARFATLVAEQLRFERLTLAVGQRFFELRALDPSLVAQAVLRGGDLRLLPLVESRAYRDEPEEVAWAVLSLIAGRPIEGPLRQAVDRTMADTPGLPLQVPLTCRNCKETLQYGFERAYVDVEAKEGLGDPAFVGDVVCKACGTPDQLEATEETAQILTAHMMQFLTEAQLGPPGPALVAPAQTTVAGKKMGLAEAYRELSADVERSPESVRPRLHRARLGLLLRRATLEEDLTHILAADPTSVEGRVLDAHRRIQRGQIDEAMEMAVTLVRELENGPEPRLYETADVPTLKASLEDLILELSDDGAPLPDDVDLTAAEQRRIRREEERQEAEQAAISGPPR